jgi:copper resistance protein D
MITFTSLVRAIHLAACVLLLGNVVFRLFVSGPILTRAKKDAGLVAFDSLDRKLRKLTAWGLAVSFISGFLWLWLVAARMSGGNLISALYPAILGALLERTQFGHLWEVRLAIITGLALLLFVRKRGEQLVQLLFTAGLLAALSLAGHAGASISEGRWIHLANDAFHLIAAGIWPAGLAPFAIFLTQTLQAKEPEEMQVAALVTQRFSFISLVTVGVLAITGTVNGYFLVGTFHGLVTTIYGRLLVLKMAVFGAMVMIGALNLLWLKPRIVVAAQSAALWKSWNFLRSLRRNVLAELCLGAILMVVVGVLGITPPAARFDMSTGGSVPYHDNSTPTAQSLEDLPLRSGCSYDQLIRRSSCICIRQGCVGTTRTLKP